LTKATKKPLLHKIARTCGSLRVITYEAAIGCLKTIFERQFAKSGHAPATVVVVGGTALAAHGVRMLSEDVDYFSTEIDEDIVHVVEQEYQAQLGEAFKIDATPTENLWGPLLLRDIAHSPVHETIIVGDSRVQIRKLSLEDLVMVKLTAGREKDEQDLLLLAERTEPDTLVARFNQVIGWYGDRASVIEFSDRFVEYLEGGHGINPHEVIDNLSVPSHVKVMLKDSREVVDAGKTPSPK
jgi:predicted nucleotidyltransferase